MTDQPKPTRWERDEGGDDIYFWSKPGDANLIVISGPDREANAALFIRAQHMDELVEWATGFVALEDNALKEWANESLIPWTGDEPCMVRLRRLKDILAKIDGGK